jgi:hypothetical protein
MAEQNWYRRFVESYGPNFRIDINNPQMGYSGAHVYDIYGVTDQDEKANISLDHNGKLKFNSDRTIEIVAGEQQSRDGKRDVDILVHTRNGDICITASKNGEIRIGGKNIIIDADDELTLKAGNEIKVESDNGIQLCSNSVDTKGLAGNMIPTALQWGSKVFAGSFVGADFITDQFSLSIG